MVNGAVETQIREILQILLDNLRNILNPLSRRLRRVGERLATAIHLGQRALEGRGRARRLAAPPPLVMALGRESAKLGRRVGGNIGHGDGGAIRAAAAAAQGGRGQQGGLVLVVQLLLLMIMIMMVMIL